MTVKKRVTRARAKRKGVQLEGPMYDRKQHKMDCKSLLYTLAGGTTAGSQMRREAYKTPKIAECRKLMANEDRGDYVALITKKKTGKNHQPYTTVSFQHKSNPSQKFKRKPLSAEHKAKLSKAAKAGHKMRALQRDMRKLIKESGPSPYSHLNLD
jgi:hypothetical protein